MVFYHPRDVGNFERAEARRNEISAARARKAAEGVAAREELIQQERTERLRRAIEKRNRKHGGGGNEYNHNGAATEQLEDTGFIGKIANSIYDKNNGGMQWGYLVGGLGGTLLGGLMGNYIATAGGAAGSWLGTVATILLALSGGALGSRLGNDITASFSPSGDATSNVAAASAAPSRAATQEVIRETANHHAAYSAADQVKRNSSTVSGGDHVEEGHAFAANVPRHVATRENKKELPAGGSAPAAGSAAMS